MKGGMCRPLLRVGCRSRILLLPWSNLPPRIRTPFARFARANACKRRVLSVIRSFFNSSQRGYLSQTKAVDILICLIVNGFLCVGVKGFEPSTPCSLAKTSLAKRSTSPDKRLSDNADVTIDANPCRNVFMDSLVKCAI